MLFSTINYPICTSQDHYIHRMPSTALLTRAGASHLTRAELGVATSRVQRPASRAAAHGHMGSRGILVSAVQAAAI